MKPAPAFFPRLLQLLSRLLEGLTMVAFAALVFDVLWGVFSRYVLGGQSRWTEELAVYLLVWVSFLGGALAFREHGHLGVDYLVGKMSPGARWLAWMIAEVIVALFAILLVYGGGLLMGETFRSGQTTPAMGWKVGYFYAVVPLSGLFITIFTIEHLFLHWKNRPLPEAPEVDQPTTEAN